MNRGNWKDLMDYVFEIDEDIAVIIAYSDIAHKEGYSSLYFKDITVDSFWKVIGRGDNESILNSIKEWECDVDKEEIYKLNNYSNFQPLWTEDNIKKDSKIL